MEKIEKVEPPSWKKPPLPEQSFISLSGKPFIQPKREIPAQEQITLEPELEEALSHATDAEMCDIAAILGMYTLMSNKQYYDAICSGEICNTEGISSECTRKHGRPHPRAATGS